MDAYLLGGIIVVMGVIAAVVVYVGISLAWSYDSYGAIDEFHCNGTPNGTPIIIQEYTLNCEGGIILKYTNNVYCYRVTDSYLCVLPMAPKNMITLEPNITEVVLRNAMD